MKVLVHKPPFSTSHRVVITSTHRARVLISASLLRASPNTTLDVSSSKPTKRAGMSLREETRCCHNIHEYQECMYSNRDQSDRITISESKAAYVAREHMLLRTSFTSASRPALTKDTSTVLRM